MNVADLRRYADVLEEQNARLPPLKTLRNYSLAVKTNTRPDQVACEECGECAPYRLCVSGNERNSCFGCLPAACRSLGVQEATAREFQQCIIEVSAELGRRARLKE